MSPSVRSSRVPALAVFCSGRGTNLQAILDAIRRGRMRARVALGRYLEELGKRNWREVFDLHPSLPAHRWALARAAFVFALLSAIYIGGAIEPEH